MTLGPDPKAPARDTNEHQEHADTGRCAKCGVEFDPNDTRFIDSTRRHRNTPFCKGCVDACHDSEIADHFCVVDRWHHGHDYRQRQPEYAPMDITPPELLPTALAHHVPAWAEAAPTPADVHDWEKRQAVALVPFQLDARGWPLHPHGRTGRTGRNLGRWGENAAADPIVVAGTGQDRRVLLITRDDIHQEAIPGGMVDPGETAPAALLRELREETSVDLADHRPVILGKDVVDDWRNTDHAWVASTVALYLLPVPVTAVAGDDAADANWWPFGSLDQLEAAIRAAGRTLYAAHRPLLQRALDHLAK